MTKPLFDKLRLLFLVLTLALGSASCSSSSRFQVGYAEFWVEFYDRVVDWTGRVQTAYCGRYLLFTGDIDTACSALPMVWSYAQNAFVECTYRDSLGQRWYYTDLFYFWPGYVQEPACFDGYVYPAGEPSPQQSASSQLDRDEDGQVVVSELPGASPQRELSSEALDLALARQTLAARLSERRAPDELPSDEPGAPVRVTEPELGEPPQELLDPDAGRASQSELSRDALGRVQIDQELDPDAEVGSLDELRELIRQRRGGEPLPDTMPGDELGEPLRRTDPTLGRPEVEPQGED